MRALETLENDDVSVMKKKGTFSKYSRREDWETAMERALQTDVHSPLSGYCLVKSLGDKGNTSFKEALLLMNQVNCNSACNFSLIFEFFNVPDTHTNLEVAFREQKAEAEALGVSSLVMFASKGTTAAKVIPGRCKLSTKQRRTRRLKLGGFYRNNYPTMLGTETLPLVNFGVAVPEEALGTLVDWAAPTDDDLHLGIVVLTENGDRFALGVGYFADIADSLTLHGGWYAFEDRVAIDDA